MDVKTLSAVIGHTSAETTLDIYTHITGKKHPRSVYAHSREECEEKLAALIREMKAEITAAKVGA